MDAFEVRTITIPLSECPAGGTVIYPVLRAPTLAQGGGFTVLDAVVWPKSATGAGTAWTLSLVNGGTLGTVLGGTIGSSVGGTASPFSANTPYAVTIVTTSNINMVSAGQYLAVKKTQEGATSAPDGVLIVRFISGR